MTIHSDDENIRQDIAKARYVKCTIIKNCKYVLCVLPRESITPEGLYCILTVHYLVHVLCRSSRSRAVPVDVHGSSSRWPLHKGKF